MFFIKKVRVVIISIGVLVAGLWYGCDNNATPRILFFSKTEGFRHADAIDASRLLIMKLAKESGTIVDISENASDFNDNNLKRYSAIVFSNNTGSLFNPDQQTALQRHIQAGGGYVGIHASADVESSKWQWFVKMQGAAFYNHANIQKGTYRVVDKSHLASSFLPDSFSRIDEFYNFTQVSPDIKVLVTLDESTYQGGNMGPRHPAVWYQEFEGGRSFYTSMGHTKETYSELFFIKQLREGLKWAMGGENPKKLDYSNVIPEQSRFKRNVLMEGLDEPIQMAIANDLRVFFAQRRGEVIEYNQETKSSRSIGKLSVTSKYEDGLLGLTLDPKFEKNHWIYTYRTLPMGGFFCVSRFQLDKNGLIDQSSEKILLKIPKDILDGSHTGGALLFDPRGNGDLFITVGDNTSPREWVYGPIDERPGREFWDAQRSAANTNDFRGKILRIHPEPDGTYTVPKGNLFLKGTPKTLPEIYTMGHRQPWRISMDTKTGWIYEGEVGPDARVDSAGIGPKGYDEFNILKKAGNYGWPYFLGANLPFWNYDFATGISGNQFDAAKPINDSKNNTGIINLPPAEPAALYYPYSTSRLYPLMGTGGRSAVGGPFFRKANYKNAKGSFPKYYDGKWFITDWIRGWLLAITFDDEGNYKNMEQFLPGEKFDGPLDMTFGPDGSLYILQYGNGWFKGNDDAKLERIDFISGNRSPVAKANASNTAGAVPFKVDLDANGTKDYDDGDKLSYQWEIINKGGKMQNIVGTKGASFILTEPGLYKAVLTVTDSEGAKNSDTIKLTAGNEMPHVKINIIKGNQTFFFPGEKIEYAVDVNDKEDGTLSGKSISLEKVNMRIDFISEGYTPLLGDPTPTTGTAGEFESMVLNASDCYSCHAIKKKSIGPNFVEIAERYKTNIKAPGFLALKIISGGGGNWGQTAMSAHPDLPKATAVRMANYILSFSKAPPKSLPLKGTYTFKNEKSDSKAVYLLQASYLDGGQKNSAPVTGKQIIVLRSPEIALSDIPVRKGSMNVKLPSTQGQLEMLTKSGDYLGLGEIDFTGVKGIKFNGISNAGKLQVRLDSPSGQIIGESIPLNLKASTNGEYTGAFKIECKSISGVHKIYLILNGKSMYIVDKILFYRK